MDVPAGGVSNAVAPAAALVVAPAAETAGSSGSSAPGAGPATAKIVRQGWLQKRGEHIKNWRPRYFILKEDGQFLGFRSKPAQESDLLDPLNNFTVRNCEIIESNRPRPFTFSIRGLQFTTVVVRTFHVEKEEER